MSLLFSNDLLSAYVLEIVDSFQRAKPDGYLGRTALQKLVYFCKAVGTPVPCSFEIYNFGPYSEDVTRSANYLLADDVLADVSPNPAKYSSYRVGTNATQINQEFRFQAAYSRLLIDSIVGVLAGSTPSELELVATLHFVNAKLKGLSGTRPTIQEVVQKFKDVKGDKFEDADIDRWYSWLDRSNLL